VSHSHPADTNSSHAASIINAKTKVMNLTAAYQRMMCCHGAIRLFISSSDVSKQVSKELLFTNNNQGNTIQHKYWAIFGLQVK